MKGTDTKVTSKKLSRVVYNQREKIYAEGKPGLNFEKYKNSTILLTPIHVIRILLWNIVSSVTPSKPINIKSCVAVRERAWVY